MFKIRIAPNILALVLTIFVISSLKSQINSTSFASKVDFSVGLNTSAGLGVVADLNNDNKPEVLVAYNSNSTTGQIAIFPNNASPGNINSSSFGPVITLPAISNVLQLDAVDLDGDGKADIVASPYTGTNTATNFSIYRNTSVGTSISFSIPMHIALISCMSPIKLKDMDGDGKADLVAGFWYLGQVRVYRNTSTLGNISFDISGATIINVGNQPISLLCNDFSGDGITDIAICNFSSNSIMVFKNTSSLGTFNFTSPVVTILTGSLPSRIVAADMDNDMKMDILVSNYNSGNIGIYKNTSSLNNLSFSTATTFSSLTNPLQAGCADFDADGKQDVVVSYESLSTISVWRNFGLNSTINANTIGNRKGFTSGGTIVESYVADIDGDNKTDIVTVNRSNGTISVFKNQTKPSNGLIAHYPFNGNAGDSSGFENHGTVFGAALANDRKGKSNSAFYFNGASRVNIPVNVSLTPSNRITIAVWVRSEPKSSGWNTLLTYRNSNSGPPYNSYAISTIPLAPYSNKWAFFLSSNQNSLDNEVMSKNAKTDFVWTHIATTYDGTAMRIYVNGVLDSSNTINLGNFVYNNISFTIGDYPSVPNHGFTGTLDDLRVYDRSLNLTEIEQLAEVEKTYYTKPAGSINLLSTWGTNPDGSGSSPLNFSSNNITYNIVNDNTTLSGNFKVNGVNSTLVFGDGIDPYNFILAGNDTLSADSIYINSNITMTVNGTLQTTKMSAGSASTVQYIRSSSQSLAGGQYENLVISSSLKTLTGNTTIRGTLAMLNSINCNGYNLTLGTSVSNRGTLNRTTGTIIGRFIRWFANTTNTGATGLFPIGNSSKYTPMQMEFTTAPSAGGTISCEFIPTNPGNVGLPQFDFSNGLVLIDKTAIDGFWRVVASGVTGGAYTGTVTANNFTGINSFANLRMVRRSTAGSWTLQGTANNTTGSNSAAIVSRTGLTAITGEYGIGGDVSQNPLPVKLTQFSADLLSDKQVLLKWQTVQEINANKFIVKRSTDKQNWTLVGEVKANNNSNRTINYELLDETIKNGSGVVYYQLVQVDLNGDEYVSPIASLNLSKEMFSIIKVYPNPAADKINIEGAAFPINIYDVMGKLVMKVTNEGDLDISHLEKGVYLISDKNSSTKLIKQ